MNIIERLKAWIADVWRRMKQWGGGGPPPTTPP